MSAKPIALSLILEDGKTAFEPGERLRGVASWSAPAVPRQMELRLLWTTESLAGRDLRIAESHLLPEPLATEQRPFVLALPTGPYSFDGKLISLRWAIELVAQPGEDRRAVTITIAPGRRAIALGVLDVAPPRA